MAAWFRLKYPHICAGAIAASAPVAQFDAPCDAFGRIVTADYSSEGDFCSGTIRKSWAAIDNVTSTSKKKKDFFFFDKKIRENATVLLYLLFNKFDFTRKKNPQFFNWENS